MVNAATHDPSVFDVLNEEAARRIILTPEDSTTEARWSRETPYLVDLISSHIDLAPDSTILDYGCGIGRMAKALIERHDCSVIGIEPSTTMASLAMRYVGTNRFSVASAYERSEPFADAAIAIWVLQHCPRVCDDVVRIARALKPGGKLFVVNLVHRSVPTVEQGWVDDGLDVFGLLSTALGSPIAGARLDQDMTTKRVASASAWAVYRRRPPDD